MPASVLESPISGQAAAPQPRGSHAELLGLLAATWQGGGKHAPQAHTIARAWSGGGGGASGGFLIHPTWLEAIFDKARQYQGPLARCVFGKTKAREFWVRGYNEKSRADGSRYGGLLAKWRGGGSAETESLSANVASQPAMAQIQFSVSRLMVYTAPISRDLLLDSTLFETMMDTAVMNEFRYQIEAAMFMGNGAGLPMGVVNAPSTITVAKDGGQTNGTITTTNIDGLWKALYGPCRRSATWHANDDTMLAIDEVATAAGWPQAMYLPQGVGGNQFALIKGRPLISAEQLPAIGTPGDLVLADFSQYMFVYHVMNESDSGAEVAVGLPSDSVDSTASDQFLFDTDCVAFRYKLRGDGKSLWPTTIKNINGFTVGPAVILAAR